jgi:hypothetical protein
VSEHAVIEAEMHSLSARLRRARQDLSGGTIVDLTPIERDVKGLCRAVGTLSPDDAGGLRPRIVGLLEEINHLGENLRAGLDELAQLLSAASERRKALTAYAGPKIEKS